MLDRIITHVYVYDACTTYHDSHVTTVFAIGSIYVYVTRIIPRN